VTIQQALGSSGLDAREARLLLAEASGFSQSSIIAFPERALPASIENTFLEYIERRKRGEPIAYIVGRKEFYGIDLAVNPAVLIPRPETELLVELALARSFGSMVDLGTGSGALALAIKKQRPAAKVVAVEASAAALVVAQRNATKLGLEIDFRHGQWFAPVAGERFDLIVGNPPYVAAGDPCLADLRFEPRGALLAGPEGLDSIREIVTAAGAFMFPGAWLLLEHGLGQDKAVRELIAGAGLESVTTWPDLAGIARVSGGRLKS
jgi:release factor glutamine methyltransferase